MILNICNISRFISVGSASVPVSEIVPVMMTNLPLKEDKDEYEMVFKALTVLYSAGRKIHFGLVLSWAG